MFCRRIKLTEIQADKGRGDRLSLNDAVDSARHPNSRPVRPGLRRGRAGRVLEVRGAFNYLSFSLSLSFSILGGPILTFFPSSSSRLIALYPPDTTSWPSLNPSIIS